MSVPRLFARRPLIALAALAAAGLAAPTLAQTVLTLSSWVPPSHILSETQKDWCTQLEQKVPGKVKCTVLPRAVSAPAGHLRRGAQRPGGCVFHGAWLHAGAVRHHPDGRGSVHGQFVRGHFGGLSADVRQTPGVCRGAQGCPGVGGVHPWAGHGLQHQEAGEQGRGPGRVEMACRHRRCGRAGAQGGPSRHSTADCRTARPAASR